MHDVKNYISSMGELWGAKVRLCSDDDPKSQLTLAEYCLDGNAFKFLN